MTMTKDDLAYFRQRCARADNQFAPAFSSREMREVFDEIERLQADNSFLKDENEFLCMETTKINNVAQPLWGELRQRRINLGRNPQTGAIAKAERIT